MVHLIDKSAVVAEIERRLEELNPKKGEFMGRPLRSVNPKTFPRESELEKLLSFLDTLEVKEINSTDAFIEQATLWLLMNARKYASIHKMIEDFIEAMKNVN